MNHFFKIIVVVCFVPSSWLYGSSSSDDSSDSERYSRRTQRRAYNTDDSHEIKALKIFLKDLDKTINSFPSEEDLKRLSVVETWWAGMKSSHTDWNQKNQNMDCQKDHLHTLIRSTLVFVHSRDEYSKIQSFTTLLDQYGEANLSQWFDAVKNLHALRGAAEAEIPRCVQREKVAQEEQKTFARARLVEQDQNRALVAQQAITIKTLEDTVRTQAAQQRSQEAQMAQMMQMMAQLQQQMSAQGPRVPSSVGSNATQDWVNRN